MSEDAPNIKGLQDALLTALDLAKSAGAESADALGVHGQSLSVSVREGKLDAVDNSEGKDIGLTVFVGQRQASVSGSDFSTLALKTLAERAVAMARIAPEDPYCGLADTADLARSIPNLDLFDGDFLAAPELLDRAKTLDSSALAVDGVTQADGATAYCERTASAFISSGGFSASRLGSRHGLSVSAIAAKDGQMVRDYDYAETRFLNDLSRPETIGASAGQRASARMGAGQIASGRFPVVFDNRVSRSLVSAFLSAISGSAISRGVSFLKDKNGAQVFASGINIIEDPHILRGLGSRPYDGEGVATSKKNLIDQGMLTGWLLNCPAARQLGLKTTGNASRGTGSPPGIAASNVYMRPGNISKSDLMVDISEGVIVTEMFGPSLNANTGDYSVGVGGFKIENGRQTSPVSEITIAGNLLEMFAALIPADDLQMKLRINAPSLLIPEMAVGGA